VHALSLPDEAIFTQVRAEASRELIVQLQTAVPMLQ
jgi:hypothetical protein